jgi:hypothetical protein
MGSSEDFLGHATECRHMAKFAHDPMDRAVWTRLAERWNRCAELARDLEPALQMSNVLQRHSAHPG